MKQLLLICAVVALVGGCGGKKDDGNTGVVKPNKPSPKAVPVNIADTILEQLKKPTGELTNADLEKLTQLKTLDLSSNQLTDVKGLEKLTKLTVLYLFENPDLTKAQIDQLKKALPNCEIWSNPTK